MLYIQIYPILYKLKNISSPKVFAHRQLAEYCCWETRSLIRYVSLCVMLICFAIPLTHLLAYFVMETRVLSDFRCTEKPTELNHKANNFPGDIIMAMEILLVVSFCEC